MIKKAIAAQGVLKSVHMELDSEFEFKVPGAQRSAAVSYDGDFEKPDHWHLKVRSSGSKSEAIILGDKTYVKLPGSDTWAEKKSEAIETGSTAGEVLRSKYLESASNVKLLDKKGDSYHLKFDLDMSRLARSLSLTGVDPSVLKGKRADMEVWILKDSMRIKKATMSFADNLDVEGSGLGKLNMSMEIGFSDFNEPVSIEAPSLEAQ
jgi:hypothetical protein